MSLEYLHVIEDLPHQIREAIKLAKDIRVEGDFNKIVVTGMGGSGIPANILQILFKDTKIHVIVNKDYLLPGCVDAKTLTFVISYSGNTEETVSAFKQADAKKSKIVVVTSGGKLTNMARNHTVVNIPAGIPPRAAIGYLLFPILILLHNSRIIKLKRDELVQTIDSLHNTGLRSKAYNLASELHGKIPVIYASPHLEPAAIRWKQAINENAKMHAFSNVFSELNHNEMSAYAQPNQGFHVVLLRDEEDSVRIQRRIDLTKDIIKKSGASVTEISLKGTSLLVKLMTAIYLGDLVSYHLGIKNGVDPAETKLQEEFKKRL